MTRPTCKVGDCPEPPSLLSDTGRCFFHDKEAAGLLGDPEEGSCPYQGCAWPLVPRMGSCRLHARIVAPEGGAVLSQEQVELVDFLLAIGVPQDTARDTALGNRRSEGSVIR